VEAERVSLNIVANRASLRRRCQVLVCRAAATSAVAMCGIIAVVDMTEMRMNGR